MTGGRRASQRQAIRWGRDIAALILRWKWIGMGWDVMGWDILTWDRMGGDWDDGTGISSGRRTGSSQRRRKEEESEA